MKKIIRITAIIVTVILFTAVLCGRWGSFVYAKEKTQEQSPDAKAYYTRLENCRKQIGKITDFKPEIVLILGTGLNDYADTLDVKVTIPYADIEGWPQSTAPGHSGNLIFAEYKGLKLAVMQGRVHYYEGYSMDEVVLPVRVLHLLGANTAIFTNSAGSFNPDFRIGEFVCVEDQITSFVPSPLIGWNNPELGERFVPMTDVFDKMMQETLLKAGEKNNIPVHSGVYLQVTGPQYETPAECKMYRSLGADTISMSMGVEVIAAAHMKMKICALNCISAMGAGMEEEGFSEETVDENSKKLFKDFKVLMDSLLDSLVSN